jgi:hypothetical protein
MLVAHIEIAVSINLSNESAKNLTKREYFDTLAKSVRVGQPKSLPSFFRYFLGLMGETLARSLRISNQKLKRASSWQPNYPTVREGFSAIAKQIAA